MSPPLPPLGWSVGSPRPAPLSDAPWRPLLAIIAVSTLVRLAAALTVPLLDDEAHYWVWAQHLMWGYPDHPPMIAALVALGTRLAGDSVLGIRLLPLVFGALSTLAVYTVTRRLFSPRAGVRAALLFQVIPAFAASGIMAAPDAPLALYWLLAMLFGWMAIVEGRGWAWPAAGAMVGLVVQCKLAGGALALSLAGFVLASRDHRGWLRTPGPYLAALAAAIVLAPLAWWNVQHDWATVRRAMVIDPWVTPMHPLVNMGALLGAQFGYYAPLGFPLLLAGLVAAARRRGDQRFRFLWWCAAPTLLVVLAGSAQAIAKPHYAGPALLSGMIAASALWARWRPQRLLRATVASSVALTLLALALAAVPNPILRAFHDESRAWPDVAQAVEEILPTLGPPGEVFVAAETYQAGSQIAYALRNRVPVVVPFRGFDIWEPPARWIGRNAVLVDHLADHHFVRVARAFERLGVPHAVPVGVDRTFRLFPAFRFGGFAPDP